MRKLFLFSIVAVCAIMVSSCSFSSKSNSTSQTTETLTASNNGKGYNIEVDDAEIQKSKDICKEVMSDISIDDVKKKDITKIMKSISDSGKIVYSRNFNMINYEMFEDFIDNINRQKEDSVYLYEVDSEGSVIQREFVFDGSNLYILYTYGSWNELGEEQILVPSKTRIDDWKYTNKGWFIYELCVPSESEVTEVVDGSQMIKVKPADEKFIEITRKYLLPIGYQGNNLFISNWDSNNMNELDYTALFEFFYLIKNGVLYDENLYPTGIPEQTFEDMLTQYLPVTVDTLKKYASYNGDKNAYEWARLGCLNYNPEQFGTSIPEIISMNENEDGTTTICIDVVCEYFGEEKMYTHNLTVRFNDDGGITYLKNELCGDTSSIIPKYQYRLNNEN